MRKPILALAAAAALTLSACSTEMAVKPVAETAEVASTVASTSESSTVNPPTATEQLAALGAPEIVEAAGEAGEWDGGAITKAGTYRISGDARNITVDAPEETVVLMLDSADITGQMLIDASSAALVLTGDSHLDASNVSTDEGAIHATGNLTVTGDGSLEVTSDGDGVVAKDDLVVISGRVTVAAGDDALRGTDSVTVTGGTLELTAGGDGITSSKDDDEQKGWIAVAGGDVTIDAGDDALSAHNDVLLTGGTIELRAADKGINAGRYALMSDGALRIDATDDALHSDGAVRLSGGTVEAAAGDDGVHAEVAAVLDGADVTVTKSEEALEAGLITVSGGTVDLTAADDGINASGSTTVEEGLAAAEASETADPMEMRGAPDAPGGPGGGPMGESTGEHLAITGGTVTVNAGGDGIDSNGTAEITGGTVTVFGPTNDGNGAIDVAGGLDVSGGELWAVGSAGMAESPSATSSQAWVQSSVTAGAGTEIAVSDQAGNPVASLTTPKDAVNIVYSSPDIDAAGTYSVNGTEVNANTATRGGGMPDGPMPGGGQMPDGPVPGEPGGMGMPGALGMAPGAPREDVAVLPQGRERDSA